MKASLRPGVSRTNRIVVDRDRTIGFMGEEGRVYGTPYLVRDIEHTCRDLLLEHADPGEDSVGIDVAIKHLAPTLLRHDGRDHGDGDRGRRPQGRRSTCRPRTRSSRSAAARMAASSSTSPRPSSG